MEIKFHGGDEESGNVFAVETIAEENTILESHKHEHAHMSVLVSGVADVTIDGVTERMEGYRMVFIPANTIHCVKSVTPIIWLCLWSSNYANLEQAQGLLKLVKGT